METMVLMNRELPLQAIRRQIASGVDIIVYLGRLRDKSRRILEITEVTGMEGEQVELNPLFLFPGNRADIRQSLRDTGKDRSNEAD